MPRPIEWTEEEIRKLKLLYPSEMSFEEIVRAFSNRTPNAIRLKASRLGLKRPTIPSSVCQSHTVLLCSEASGKFNGYLFRCGDCGNWIQVNREEEAADSGLVVCSTCGSKNYLVA